MPPKRATKAPAPPPLVGPTTLSERGFGFSKASNPELVQALREALMVAPRVNPSAGGPAQSAEALAFPVYCESASKFYVPRAYGLEHFGAPTEVRLPEGADAPGLIFEGALRDSQTEPIQAVLTSMAPDRFAQGHPRGGLLVLCCAAGKTVSALYIAAQMRGKTLVVCHKEFLLNQWAERIAQFVPQAKVGRLQQSRVDVEGKDIVLASLQSIAMKDYPAHVFAGFRMAIYDECHHLGAQVFSRALAKIPAPLVLGLSATPTRKDGLTKVFEWHIGKPVYTLRKRADTSMVVQVERFQCPPNAPGKGGYGEDRTLWNGKLNYARMINDLCECGPRNERIVDLLMALHAREPERHTIVLSERRGHLRELDRMIRARGWPATELAFCWGGLSEEAMKATETCRILLATTQLISEAYDNPHLNAMIIASPITALEQPIGRIQRQKPEDRKYVPLVIDIMDGYSVFQSQAKRRLAFYKKNKYTIANPAQARGSSDEEEEEGENETSTNATAKPKQKRLSFLPVEEEQ